MNDFIMNVIQTGAYSAVFAVLLFYVIKQSSKRESYYTRFVSELCAALSEINVVSGKLDKLIELAKATTEKKKKTKSVPPESVGIPALAEAT